MSLAVHVLPCSNVVHGARTIRVCYLLPVRYDLCILLLVRALLPVHGCLRCLRIVRSGTGRGNKQQFPRAAKNNSSNNHSLTRTETKTLMRLMPHLPCQVSMMVKKHTRNYNNQKQKQQQEQQQQQLHNNTETTTATTMIQQSNYRMIP